MIGIVASDELEDQAIESSSYYAMFDSKWRLDYQAAMHES